MTRFTLLLLFTLSLVACSEDEDPILPVTVVPTGMDTTLVEPDTNVTYLALGDSYTIGTSVSPTESWPRQLTEALVDEKGVRITNLQIVATNGWRTDDLQEGIHDNTNELDQTYGLVSLLIGVNDQFQGVSRDLYEAQFQQLLSRAIELAGNNKDRVFVVSIPDYAYTPFGREDQDITRGINIFNSLNRRIAESASVLYLDVTDISREGLDDPELVASDGLHPSGKQYRRWVEEVLLQPVADLLTD